MTETITTTLAPVELLCELTIAGQTRKGITYDSFRTNGPEIKHRGQARPLRLLAACDLSNLDECLARLPQDRKRMGFRLNVNDVPMMLRPSGNWAEARISQKEDKRLGWKATQWYVTSQGLAMDRTITSYRRTGTEGLPFTLSKAKLLAEYCQILNAHPDRIVELGESSTQCMCCGKALLVERSQFRGVGPECLSYLNLFIGVDQTVAEIEEGEE
jgi:hypothetical protein